MDLINRGKKCFLLENGQGRFSVFYKQQMLGFVEIYENEFHNRNCYVKVELKKYGTILAIELFDLLQKHIKRPLQVMISSMEEEKIAFLEKSGFQCKRKCYELNVTANSLRDIENVIFEGKSVYTEYNDTFVQCLKGSEEYDLCARFLYEYYAKVHEAINPLTASYEVFRKQLPEEVYYDCIKGEIFHVAFVEENEIAYVGSEDKNAFKRFIIDVVLNLFMKYKELFFECDDCDEAAMMLQSLFAVEVNESYNTYVREWDI